MKEKEVLICVDLLTKHVAVHDSLTLLLQPDVCLSVPKSFYETPVGNSSQVSDGAGAVFLMRRSVE
jgi:hypothetical protein